MLQKQNEFFPGIKEFVLYHLPKTEGRLWSSVLLYFTIVALQAFYVYLTGKETAVEFAGLAGSCGGDKKGVQLVAHEAAGSHIFGRYIYNRKKGAVFCASLFNAAATPEGYPEIIF